MGDLPIGLETRLMVVSTRHNRGRYQGSQADIAIDLENISHTIKQETQAVTVESISFSQYMFNVSAHNNTVTIIPNGSILPELPDGVPQTFEITPNWYNGVSFAKAFQDAFNNVLLGGLYGTVLSVELVEPEPNLPLLHLYVLSAAFGPAAPGVGFDVPYDRDSLAFQMGSDRDRIIEIRVEENFYLYPNLAGEPMLYLHSEALTNGKNSVSGRGTADSVLASIPISVPFGAVQTCKIDNSRPMLVFDKQTNMTIESLDFSLRDGDGRTAILEGSGEIYVTLRLWIAAR